MIYFCCDETRRNAVKDHPTLNGIDFLDVVDNPADPPKERQRTLLVHFLKDLASSPPPSFKLENIRIEGGERRRNIAVTKITLAPGGKNNVVEVRVSEAGDFSTYTLRLVADRKHDDPPAGFDPILSAIDFSFKVACPTDFDCRQDETCPPEQLIEPEINYLAKDYASFRQLMLDRMSALMPQWTERNAADLGITLVELLAYVGDYLSYRQDAVATEAYLGTARRRVSVRRHARLVDYHMNDGSNARAWVQVQVSQDVAKLPKGTQIFSRLEGKQMLITPPSLSPPFIPADYEQAKAAQPIIFETMHDAKLFAAHNEMRFHTWGDERCCLPKGATRATLLNTHFRLNKLKAGDVIIFIEARNPENGIEEEADPTHRHAVRLTKVKQADDPLFTDAVKKSEQLHVLNIEWSSEDALPFPLCLWTVSVGGDTSNKRPVSIALGNIVLADHGETILPGEPLGSVPDANPALDKASARGSNFCSEKTLQPTPPRFRPRLQKNPVTFAASFDPKKPPASASAVMTWPVEEFLPEVTLASELDGVPDIWEPQRDLLNSSADKAEFVLEVESDNTASIRFGDDRFGKRPASGTSFTATYRVGNGVAGNVGAGALAHIVSSEAAITEVSNPLPARGGAEPESIERARQNAPSAFRTQERAVTPADYGEVAERHSGIQRAAATFRWTGSWRTVFLTVDRLGGLDVDAEFEDEMRAFLERYRMAGHDLELDGPRFVSLEIEMTVCVEPDYFRSDVRKALLEIFSRRKFADGTLGLFHPDNFTFGQTVYLSKLIAAAQEVEGVASVEVTKFQRQGVDSETGKDEGKLLMERLEIARLDNDPNFPDHGIFRLTLKGGR